MVKWNYYFLTLVPFILFHMKPAVAYGKLSEQILKPINLYQIFSAHSLKSAFKTGVGIYIIGALAIVGWLIFHGRLC
ncbi:MAG: hypothetical protein H7336_07705 [Bacteriovorax sp.]|nr:hypothetical protein [Bacteriovorax sp.]